MSKKLSKLWVDPDFKCMIKSRAAEKDMSIIDYTRFLAEGEDKSETKKKKFEFFF